jgi:Fungal chitosanase of glycosyl hydrolase group 75
MQGGFVNRSRAAILSAILMFTAGVTIGQNAQEPPAAQSSATGETCVRSVLLNFTVNSRDGRNAQEAPIWQLPGKQAFFFTSGITIDADGSPNAYNPENTGLDDLANAGNPDHWDGIITDTDGNPLIQGPGDPFPGYYVSCTSLVDRTKPRTDPTRYVDASKIPYIVLPGNLAREAGAQLGDFAVVVNLRNGKSAYAIFADVGTFGEGSIALANSLGIWSDARQGGRRDGILYLVFPGSGNRQPRSIDEINAEAEKLLQDFGGAEKLTSCAADQAPSVAATPTVTAKTASDIRVPSTAN